MFKDFKELLSALNAHKVRYLVIGGQAVNIHAQPRATKDLDFWMSPDPANAAIPRDDRKGLAKALIAVSKLTLCLRRLLAALAGSHSNAFSYKIATTRAYFSKV